MRQWLNEWNGTGQSPGSAPTGPPGVPGTGDHHHHYHDLDLEDDDHSNDLDLGDDDLDFDEDVKPGIGGTMPGTGARVDDKQSTLSR